MTASRFQEARKALFEALSGVCDQIEESLSNEQAGTAPNETRLAKLEAENEALREQLAHVQSSVKGAVETNRTSNENAGSRPTTLLSSFPTNSTTSNVLKPGATTGCKGDCSKILRRYHALSANFKTAKDALQRRKVEKNQWAQRAQYLDTMLRAAEAKYGIQILDQQVPCVELPSIASIEAEDKVLDPKLSFASDYTPAEDESELPALPPTTVPNAKMPLAATRSSQTTQGQASDALTELHLASSQHANDDDTMVKNEPSSDIPELVSEREVRKRKRAHDSIDEVVKPLIKKELNDSSSPVLSITAVKLHTQESLDLNDITQRMQTPRKRLLLDRTEPRTENMTRYKPGFFTPVHSYAPKHPHSARLTRQNSALMPLDGNVRHISSTEEKPDRKDRRRQLLSGIAQLAEGHILDAPTASVRESKVSSTKSVQSRLGALLDGGIKDVDIIEAATPKIRQTTTPARKPTLRAPGRRNLPFGSEENRRKKSIPTLPLPVTTHSISEPRRPADNSIVKQPAISRSSGILRTKPVADLSLSDFKINPSANEGHDFAFSDVVRDKSERACLPGCVDMHCCGKHFRALAISQRPDPPLTSAQRQEEQKLLESYLGDSSYRLATMNREERLELWVEAKTQELANKYGKHRHRFSRMQSPPGFWDADFPDTQRLKADRKEAAKRIEQAIMERYREALRPDGRWRFMDE